MDNIESWYSETGGLLYDEPKAHTWHLLVWICHERGSRHPLTTAVHKWSYKSETLSLWPRQAYGSGCSCPPSPTSLSHVTTGLKTVWHLEETTRSSAKMLGGAGRHEPRATLQASFWCLECCDGSVNMEGATTHRRSSVERDRHVDNATENRRRRKDTTAKFNAEKSSCNFICHVCNRRCTARIGLFAHTRIHSIVQDRSSYVVPTEDSITIGVWNSVGY